MIDVLFYVFSALTVLAALAMVMSPNAVNGAMCMIVAFAGTGALFVLLEAYFLAVLQILVYTGAVMVLFLFIIMLLDAGRSDAGRYLRDKMTMAAAAAAFALMVLMAGSLFAAGGDLPEPPLAEVRSNPEGSEEGIPFTTSAKSYGYSLFTKYMLPFQMTGFLLLAAMVGIIAVSKKPGRESPPEEESAGEGAAK